MTKISKVENLGKDKKIDVIKNNIKNMVKNLDTKVSDKIKNKVEVIDVLEKVIVNIDKGNDVPLLKEKKSELLPNPEIKEGLDDSK